MGVTRGGQQDQLTFLDAAERVLATAGHPLTPTQIIARALSDRLLRSEGVTPEQTMKAKLATDILNRRGQSRFMRSSQNMFALRRWTNIPEFVAGRFQRALLDEDIIVFDRQILREFFPTDGITSIEMDRGQELISQTSPMKRSEAERSLDVIQLVSQYLVIHQHRVATHKRTRRLPEARLHGVWSLLFGGHLNPEDVAPLFGPFDPVNGPLSITRELSEEVKIVGGAPKLELVGGIYDPRRDVSKQHLGVLYTVRVADECEIEIGERGFLQQLTFSTVSELSNRIDDFENWSELVFRELLQSEALVP